MELENNKGTSNYGKCSKISNTLLVLFTKNIGFQGWNLQNACLITNKKDPDQTASPIWVCTVCLGLFDRQIVPEFLEHLPYLQFSLWLQY